MATLGFTEILRYGADAPQVTSALSAAYDELDAVVSDDRHEVLAGLRLDWARAVRDVMPPAFAAIASQSDRLGLD